MLGKSLLKHSAALILLCASPEVLRAEEVEIYVEESSAPARQESQPGGSSRNIDKTGQFLPGEKVRTETGQTLKVWSTVGPVPVSPAPEPFEDQDEQLSDVPDDVHIVIDKDGHKHPKRRTRKRHDSFDVGPESRYPR